MGSSHLQEIGHDALHAQTKNGMLIVITGILEH